VDVSQARVVLTGTVSTYDARTAAEEDAWRVAGVDTVDNQLTVRYPPGEAVPTDEEIASNALNTLRWQTDIDLSDVEIAVAGGHVTLRGTVDS
jgi:osmotically-inducible protein OsmY